MKSMLGIVLLLYPLAPLAPCYFCQYPGRDTTPTIRTNLQFACRGNALMREIRCEPKSLYYPLPVKVVSRCKGDRGSWLAKV